MITSHTSYDSHDGPPTLDARRLPTRIRPAFAHDPTQDPVFHFQAPSRLLPLRCASSVFLIPPSLTHVYMHDVVWDIRTYWCIYDDDDE